MKDGRVPKARCRPRGVSDPPDRGLKGCETAHAPVREAAVRIGGARGELGPHLWLPFPPGEPRFREGGALRPSLN